MKKIDFGYVAKWFGGAVVIAALVFALGVVIDQAFLGFGALVVLVIALVLLPSILRNKMSDKALELEKSFADKGFAYQHKFTSNSGVFYIDVNGRLGIVWRYNPSQIYFADMSQVTDIRTHDGKQLRGTSLVSCQFKLGKERIKIYTLRVSNGQYAMNSPEVLEAISKADQLCEMLSLAKENAAKAAVR